MLGYPDRDERRGVVVIRKDIICPYSSKEVTEVAYGHVVGLRDTRAKELNLPDAVVKLKLTLDFPLLEHNAQYPYIVVLGRHRHTDAMELVVLKEFLPLGLQVSREVLYRRYQIWAA